MYSCRQGRAVKFENNSINSNLELNLIDQKGYGVKKTLIESQKQKVTKIIGFQIRNFKYSIIFPGTYIS